MNALLAAVVLLTADQIVVDKSDHTLTLYRHGQAMKTYTVSLGRQPVGRKEREGDDRTPEGRYVIDSRNAHSKYHIALHVSYPNAEDVRRARAAGVSPGGAIMIHGLRDDFSWLGRLHRMVNWTHGCIAVTDGEIEEIARAVPNGTPIIIRP
jgi:murein L,D-transpeptidase YafK